MYFSVDDLELDLEDIIYEMDIYERKRMMRLLKEYDDGDDSPIEVKSLDDELKLKTIKKVWGKYNSIELERRLND